MRTEKIQNDQKNNTGSYADVLSEVIGSTKDVIRSELNLFTIEFKAFMPNFTKHVRQVAIFGSLLVLSVFSFLAFLIIGLGEILEGRYWLSSLVVNVVLAVIGGPLCLNAFRKIKMEDFKFIRTKQSLNHTLRTTKEKVQEVKTAAQGARYEQNTIH